jgi:hypothetical protein
MADGERHRSDNMEVIALLCLLTIQVSIQLKSNPLYMTLKKRKKQKGMLVRDRTTTKNTFPIGKGVIDTMSNMVLSTKLNRALPNEKQPCCIFRSRN